MGLEKAQRIPDLDVSIGSQYDASVRERVNLVGVSMPIPLFNRNQGNVLAATRRADQSRDLRNAAELRLRTETRQALDLWQTANTEVRAFNQQILPAAQLAVDSATRGFEMGKFSFLDVLDAQRTLIAARTQYLTATAQATDAWVRIGIDLAAGLHKGLGAALAHQQGSAIRADQYGSGKLRASIRTVPPAPLASFQAAPVLPSSALRAGLQAL